MFDGAVRGGRRSFSPKEKPERPASRELRRRNLHRVFGLFRAYRTRLAAVLALILVSSALGVLPAFLLKGVLEAIPRHDTSRLSIFAGGMILVSIVTGALGVFQTLLSNRIGQDVMHDLRTRVFRHLQRLSLAFFTRTRTGEVQSRISNDIGGVQSVLTSTATSIVSNVTTVIATAIGMIALSWELSLFAFALVPVFVLLTRRVGAERRRIATTTQETLA
ncbi:MAG TPA: ABC transporter transmembrane domain-containing protein, partial [Gemmatimonadaceae bacterium]|nr:ABC transporter transmembrane domain-containing protein [Gemmatimonadaceae bacterium]